MRANNRVMNGRVVLALYAGAAAALLIRGCLVRHRMTLTPPPDDMLLDASPFDGESVGVIAGGRARAIAAAVAWLRVNNLLRIESAGPTLVTHGSLPPDAPPMARAVHHAVGDSATIRDVDRDVGVLAAVVRLHMKTTAAGFINHGPRNRTFPAAGRPLLLLAAVGAVATMYGLITGATVWPLALATVVIFVAGLRHLVGPPLPTPTAHALARLEKANSHLAPRNRPALLTYGPDAAALAVGLFGAGALAATDAALAVQADPLHAPAPPAIESESASGSGGDGTGCGGCGGCGGGGCGG
jgi:uncharacterized protein (TIGR04222 family)